MAPQARFILRILSGHYLNAELALMPGQYTLGRSLDCDISVDDEQLSEKTLQLTLTPQFTLEVQMLQSNHLIGCNGVVQQQNSFLAQPYDCLQIGAFAFAVGVEGHAWPSYPPLTELVEPPPAEALPSEVADTGMMDDMPLSAEDDLDFSDEMEDLRQSHVFPNNDNQTINPEPKPAATGNVSNLLNKIMEHRRVIAAIGSVITLASSSMVWLVRDGKEMTQLISDGKPAVIKSVSPIISKQQPVNVAAQAVPVINNDVLISSVKDLLTGLGYGDLSVTAGSQPGELIITGYTDQWDRWQEAKTNLQRDVPGLKQLLDHVDTMKQRKEKLEQLIAEAGLDGSVQVFMTDKGLVAKTSLPATADAKWQMVEQKYAELFQNKPELHRVRDNDKGLDIKSVSFGKESYVVTADGSRYMIGSVLKDGYKLEKITPQGLVLKNSDGMIKHYPLP